jgi:hypothetical protein
MHLFRSDAGEPWTEPPITAGQVVFFGFDATAELWGFSGDGVAPQTLTLGNYPLDLER